MCARPGCAPPSIRPILPRTEGKFDAARDIRIDRPDHATIAAALAPRGGCGHVTGVILRPPRLLVPFAFAVLAPVPASAQDVAPPSPLTLSGSADVFSQYRFRGLSRSDGEPAVQGDLELSHVSGVYGGLTVTSESPGPALDYGHAEVDLYAGYDHALGSSGLRVDLGLRGYIYADRAGKNLVELSAALDRQIGPVDLRAGLAYAPPQRVAPASTARDNTYLFAEGRSDIPGTPLSLHAHLGHTAGSLDYTGPYWDYRLGLTASHKAFGLDLSLVGTSVSHAAALATPDPAATWRAARSAGVITVSYQF